MKTEKILNDAISNAEKELEKAIKRRQDIQNLCDNWNEINPEKISDSEFLFMKRNSPPFENWWLYGGRGNIYDANSYFKILYNGKHKEEYCLVADKNTFSPYQGNKSAVRRSSSRRG